MKKFFQAHPIFYISIAVILCVYLSGIFISGVQPVYLWTDRLVYLLVFAIALFVSYAAGREHLRDPWRQVVQHKIGMISLIILLVYVMIGFTDSIHFKLPVENSQSQSQTKYSGEVLSLLDVLVEPIKTQEEKTYSAPFATHLFAKETIEHDDGSRTREYPRLIFGGIHLENPYEDKLTDIVLNVLKGILAGAVLWVMFCVLCFAIVAFKRKIPFGHAVEEVVHGNPTIPWRLILLTVGVFCILVGICVFLAAKYHILGTDKVGQDVFYQSLKSIRTGLVIGTLTTLIMLPFAVLLGIMAGYLKGWIDDVIQYVYTTLNSIPGVLLIAAAVLMMQVYMSNHPEMFESTAERADTRLFFLCMILGVTSWTGLCRMLRGETLKLSEVDYVQAAQAFGVSKMSIIWRHIQPNVMHIVLIAVVLDFSGLVLAEAVLSYVGVGVDPTMNSWGNMINGARLEMAREPIVWWSLFAAFIFMFTLVLAANLFSDAVRDAFDPRIRKQ